MASSDTGAADAGIAGANGTDRAAPQAAEPANAGGGAEPQRPGHRFRGSTTPAGERERMLEQLRRVEFPVALRGYERSSVDRYVEQMNRLVAEVEMSASPESAVRHALDEVGEETRGLLQRAHQTADEIVLRARAQAEERLKEVEEHDRELRQDADREAAEVRAAARQEAKEERETAARETARIRTAAQREAEDLRDAARRDAEQMVEDAEARERELSRSAEAIWRERRRLIDDMRTVGDQLVAIGETEARRFAHFPDDPAPAAAHEPEAHPTG